MNSKQQDAQFFEMLIEVLAVSVTEWFGNEVCFDVTQTPDVHTHAHSFIIRYRLTLASYERTLLVKIPHRPNETNLQKSLQDQTLKQPAQFEYEQLLTTWQVFDALNDPDCTAVQPLDFLDEWNAIVMLELQATPMRVMLTTPQIGFSQAGATDHFIGYLHKALRWLRYFHDRIGDSEKRPLSKELMRARLDKISKDVANHIGGRYQVPAKLDILHSKIGKVSGQERIARLHGDFHASNILITYQGQVCVLDPRVNSDKSSVYNDLATLLIDLSVKPISVLTGGMFTQKFLQKSQQAVVESYFERGEFEPSLLDFYCACEALFKWSMDERDFNRRKKMRIVAPLARPILTNYMHGLIRRYL